MSRTTVIKHNGNVYSAELMRVKSTSLGYEDHGILTASLHCEGKGSGVSVGGYTLDDKAPKGSYDRVPTAEGFKLVTEIMKTVGVDTWEKIPGNYVYVLFPENKGGWGGTSIGIASTLDEDRVLDFKKFFEDLRARQEREDGISVN